MWEAVQLAWHRWEFVRRIRKHGWTGTYVHGDEIPFSYSIGFWESAKAPEVIMFGVDPQTSGGLLGEAHRQILAGELTLADLAPWELDWEDGPSLAWRAVHPNQIRREHFNVAIWYRERQGLSREGLEAFQLVISDTGHKFPWEPGYDVLYRPRQPELYLPHEGPADD